MDSPSPLYFSGRSYHVIHRGRQPQACFVDDADYKFYLDTLQEFSYKFHIEVHAYTLMEDHVHLLVTPEKEGDLQAMLESIENCYARYFAETYSENNAAWQGEFRTRLIDIDNYILIVSRYIELNPVRIKLTQLIRRIFFLVMLIS